MIKLAGFFVLISVNAFCEKLYMEVKNEEEIAKIIFMYRESY